MNARDRVRSSDVTLSDAAKSAAERYDILPSELRLARALSVSTHETAQFLVVLATLPDERRVRLYCSPGQPAHVVTFTLA